MQTCSVQNTQILQKNDKTKIFLPPVVNPFAPADVRSRAWLDDVCNHQPIECVRNPNRILLYKSHVHTRTCSGRDGAAQGEHVPRARTGAGVDAGALHAHGHRHGLLYALQSRGQARAGESSRTSRSGLFLVADPLQHRQNPSPPAPPPKEPMLPLFLRPYTFLHNHPPNS